MCLRTACLVQIALQAAATWGQCKCRPAEWCGKSQQVGPHGCDKYPDLAYSRLIRSSSPLAFCPTASEVSSESDCKTSKTQPSWVSAQPPPLGAFKPFGLWAIDVGGARWVRGVAFSAKQARVGALLGRRAAGPVAAKSGLCQLWLGGDGEGTQTETPP